MKLFTKTLLRIFIITQLFIMNIAFSNTIEGLEVPLQYDESFMDTYNKSFTNTDYITVKREVTLFPKNSVQLLKFNKAMSLFETILNSESFKSKVLSYKRASNGKREFQKAYLWREPSKKLTNEEVLKVILEGNEKMRPHTIGEMNINSFVKVCKWWQKPGIWCRKVIGSTSPGDSRWIKLNWKFYKNFEVHQMVNNMVHEWIHLLGFLHGSEYILEEVPYVVGQIAETVALEIMAKEEIKNNKLAAN
jgi:hypothetical protein